MVDRAVGREHILWFDVNMIEEEFFELQQTLASALRRQRKILIAVEHDEVFEAQPVRLMTAYELLIHRRQRGASAKGHDIELALLSFGCHA